MKDGKFTAEDYGPYSIMKHKGCRAGAARHVREEGAGRRRRQGEGEGEAIRAGKFTVKVDDSQPKSTASERRRRGRAAPVLRLRGHHQAVRRRCVANDAISLELRPGEVLALLGENGAGKTTLMSILFGHYVADAGSIEVVRPAAAAGHAARGAGRRHRHGAPAFHAGRQPDACSTTSMLGTEPLWRPVSRRARRAAQARSALAQRFGLAVDPDARVGEPLGRRAAAGRDPQGALPRRAHPDPRRADRGADAAGEPRRCSPRCGSWWPRGSSIIFISHKLDEVMRVSRPRRGAARRPARSPSARRRRDQRGELAEAMVGRAVDAAACASRNGPGARCCELSDVAVAGGSGRRSSGRDADRARRRDRRHRRRVGQRSAGAGRAASGLTRRPRARCAWTASPWPGGGAAPRRAGVGRIPEDRHAVGVVGELSIGENAVAGDAIAARAFQRAGLHATGRAAPTHAPAVDRRLRRACAGPGRGSRLLSGGNMQKLMLGRVLELRRRASIVADQPTCGLDIGAVAYRPCAAARRARDPAPRCC